jgi:uncharacterized protein YbaA (DUF1428 family)
MAIPRSLQAPRAGIDANGARSNPWRASVDDVPMGKLTSFPQAVTREPSETVILAWIVYASYAVHGRMNAAAMEDPRLAGNDPKAMPFDTKRKFWGGFAVLVSL